MTTESTTRTAERADTITFIATANGWELAFDVEGERFAGTSRRHREGFYNAEDMQQFIGRMLEFATPETGEQIKSYLRGLAHGL